MDYIKTKVLSPRYVKLAPTVMGRLLCSYSRA